MPTTSAGEPVAADRPSPIADVDLSRCEAWPTGVAELDRVLGGGLVPGSVTLLGGEPGVGKSTLVLQALSPLARDHKCLLASGEESKHQVRLRAERLGAVQNGLWLVAETSLPGVEMAIEQVGPDVAVVDSIQTVFDPSLPSAAGSVAQIRHCAHRLVQLAKRRDMSVVLIGHVTKDGQLAGPMALEHVVDTVLYFEGERHQGLRLLRAQKHRFGPTGELGIFEMAETGLTGVPDASGLLLADRRHGVPGSVVAPAADGHRALLVEIQALVARAKTPMPRRSAQGLDMSRVALVLAELERRAEVLPVDSDVYTSAVGGVRVSEPAADLALALALASAVWDVPLPADLVVFGELGLGGEVRQVPHVKRRLAESARLGFTRAIVPARSPNGPAAVQLTRVSTLAEALRPMRPEPKGRIIGRARPAQPGHEQGAGPSGSGSAASGGP
jgi:DNA repair protein RadA/Sms